ncbi:MAG: rhomboid family intramembrane serine protease, partial [Phycisphaerales bacterium]|nr:rhomboid family intramembrane serine protease [Phycisphaerales bacterium]
MFIPIRTEVDSRRRAVVVPWLIGVNVVVSFGLVLAIRSGLIDGERALSVLALDPVRPRAWQFVTYAFMHDLSSPWHLLANMLFLWVFGTAVEGRLGRGWFLLFYLVGGAVAGTGHLLVSSAPVIGASGAVAAVSGAFLALFPRAHIRVLIVFFMIGFVSIPAMWFIGFYFLVDLLSQTTAMLGANRGNVAYAAHLAGYAYGFTVAVVLLATRILPRRDFDIFYLFTQSRRRAAMRAATAEAQRRNMVVRSGPNAPPKLAVAPPPAPPHAAERAEISRLHRSGDLSAAAAAYRALLARDGTAVLAEDQQLDVANQLMQEGRHAAAAAA